MNSGKIVADETGGRDGDIEGSTRGPRGPKKTIGRSGQSCLRQVSHNPNFLLVSLRKEVRRQKSRVNIVLALNKLIVQSPTKKTDNES